MNQDRIEGNWHQLKGKLKEEWGELTDDELDVAEGRLEQVAGVVQEKYGLAKDDVDARIRELEKECD